MTGVRLGSNISSLRAQRSLADATTKLSSIYERLSSGQRINHAGDDSAGLAVFQGLTTDARVYTQAIRNVNDGISALNIAEGALAQLTTISIRQKELAEQAANGTYSTAQRRAMNTEANALVDEFNRITQTTEFNGIHLTDKSISELRIQAGFGADGSISFEIADELARTVGTGSFGDRTSFGASASAFSVSLGDVNGDAILDMVTADFGANKTSVFIGNGDGTFKARASFAAGLSPSSLSLGDVNGDGLLDMVTAGYENKAFVLIGNGNGTFNARSSFATGSGPGSVRLLDVTGDGALDMVTLDYNDLKASVLVGNGNGTFKARSSFTTGANPFSVSLGDVNGDGFADMVTAEYSAAAPAAGNAAVFIGNGDGTFKARTSFTAGSGPMWISLGDADGDGTLDMMTADNASDTASVFIGNGDGTFKARASFKTGDSPRYISLGDLNNDGVLDMLTADNLANEISVFIGNGDGAFKARSSYGAGFRPLALELGDLNGDGALDIVTTANVGASALLASTHDVTTIARLNLHTRQGALDAMSTIDATLQRISSEMGAIGATQSRFSVTLNTLSSARENFSAAAGRIMDADVAEESANLVRTQILQQAATAILAQANQQPALVMQLLKG